MRILRNIVLIIIVNLLFVDPIFAGQYGSLKRNLAIIDFENRTTYEDIGSGPQDMLTSELWKSERFILLEREKVEEVIHEQDFSYSGRVTAEAAAKIGRILGADFIITGGITEAGLIKEGKRTSSRIAIDARLIDVTSTQIVLAETAYGIVEGTDMNAAIRAAVIDLVGKIAIATDNKPWQSSVMKVDGQKVYINAGSEHGILGSDRFVVFKQGEELVDPTTNVVLGYLTERLGSIIIRDVLPKFSIADISEGAGFARGDIVKQE